MAARGTEADRGGAPPLQGQPPRVPGRAGRRRVGFATDASRKTVTNASGGSSAADWFFGICANCIPCRLTSHGCRTELEPHVEGGHDRERVEWLASDPPNPHALP